MKARTMSLKIGLCVCLFLLTGALSLTTHAKKKAPPEPKATIPSLHTTRNTTLYYDPKDFPRNVTALIEAHENIDDLNNAYNLDREDPLFRFNIIMILNVKLQKGNGEGQEVFIGNTFLQALKDDSAWVRTEAVWGLGFLGNAKSIPSIIPLLDDEDTGVVNETVLTLDKLTGRNKSEAFTNEKLSSQERDAKVKYWKNWWKKNKKKY